METKACVLALVALVAAVGAKDGEFQLTILHTNDMHSRYEQTDQGSSKCSKKSADEGKCYGGMARVVHAVREERAKAQYSSGPNVIFLNAGDTFQGTVWYTVHKWRIAARFINLLQFDAISLGNHEFDDHVDGLVPYINNVSCPILAANLDLSREPRLAATKLANSTILFSDGVRIGVIGYLTPETQNISSTENVIFLDEVESIKRETAKLKSQGVNILIAIGHSGFDEDMRIAREVPDIDLVVGGHTNTFLYTGRKPDVEVPQGLYPTVVTQPGTGRKVPVVQAYAYTKYLGRLKMKFDERGEATFFQGNPILLDSNVLQDTDILNELEIWRKGVQNLTKQVVGRTKVLLDGNTQSCRMVECNLGNLIADAMVDYIAHDYNGIGWTNFPIAIQHGGGIRNSINVLDEKGIITTEDILGVLPFENSIVGWQLKGDQVREMLEWSVNRYDPTGINAIGGFLQYSGLQVTYDIHRKPNHRVVSAEARCGNCTIPTYSPLQDNATYYILMPKFLSEGGDGFNMFQKGNKRPIVIDISDVEMVMAYMQRKSPVYAGVESRIKFVVEDIKDKSAAFQLASTLPTLVSLLLILRTIA